MDPGLDSIVVSVRVPGRRNRTRLIRFRLSYSELSGPTPRRLVLARLDLTRLDLARIDLTRLDLTRPHSEGAIQPNHFPIQHRILNDVLNQVGVLCRFSKPGRKRDLSGQ